MKHLILISMLLCVCGLCPAQTPQKPDTTINEKLILENPQSVKALYPASQAPAISENSIRPYPFTLFVNKAKTQYLFAYCYEGSLQNQYSAFEIGYVDDIAPLEKIRHIVSHDSLFITDTGIKLGMHIKELKNKQNMVTQTMEDNEIWIVYRLEAQSDFCRQYHMPDYVMKVRVRDERINRIWFGFEYP